MTIELLTEQEGILRRTSSVQLVRKTIRSLLRNQELPDFSQAVDDRNLNLVSPRNEERIRKKRKKIVDSDTVQGNILFFVFFF